MGFLLLALGTGCQRKKGVWQIGEYKVDWLHQDLSVKGLDWDFFLTDSLPSSESETGKSFNLKVWIYME